MRVAKKGGHRLFERDPETARVVAEMLLELEKKGMDAVRAYSAALDGWSPASFELSSTEIDAAVHSIDRQAVEDTAWCQGNVRAFATAQMATLLPLEVEIRPGVFLGHRHIPVNRVGSYIPGGRYPMFGSAQMSIIPARVADEYAREHLELHVRDAVELAGSLTCYGSLFIGEETTVAYGDKSIGTNHILPTSRAARYTGGAPVRERKHARSRTDRAGPYRAV